MTETIGFIGVGAMGGAIAGRIVGRRTLLVHDPRRSATDELVASGARYAELPELASAADVVFLCLPGPTQVREVVLGPDGVGATLRPGAVLIDCSTSTSVLDREIAAVLTERGIGFVDAPIGGGVRRAEEGTATLMVGGEDSALATATPLLELVTSDIQYMGGVGTGHAMKLVNNLLNACNRFAALEVVALGRRCGIEQRRVIEALNRASGRNYTTEVSYTVLAQDDGTWLPQGFTLDLMLKDIHLANQLAEELGQSTPVGHLAESFAQEAVERFGPRADQSELMARWFADAL